jgi:hypothetical protein
MVLMKVLASRAGRVSCEIVATGAVGRDAGGLGLATAGTAAFCRSSGSDVGTAGLDAWRAGTVADTGSDAAHASSRLLNAEHERTIKLKVTVIRAAFR